MTTMLQNSRHETSRMTAGLYVGLGVALCLASAGGCSSSLDRHVLRSADAGEYGAARVALQDQTSDDMSDRGYILDRLRQLILTLADGQPDVAENAANQTFRLLSLQGINADRTVSSQVFNERVKIWKGEPFEQALGYTYVAIQKGELGEWDNARAAASNSLFRLKDFMDGERKNGGDGDISSEELTRRAARRDAQRPGSGDAYLDHGYVAAKTDFALGYVITGLAARALGRDDEAADNFREAATVNVGAAELCKSLASGDYNTVFIVDYGRGPEKIAYGPDNALARFQPRQASDGAGLSVSLRAADSGDGTGGLFAWVTDVNSMSQSHMWNNLEDVRTAKSTIGTVLLIGGVGVAATSDNRNAQMAGLIAAGVGALLKASASADTRHCEFFPQRVYVAPAMITREGTSVRLGAGGASMILTDLAPPQGGARLQLRYVRLVNGAPGWASNGVTMYANDARPQAPVPGDQLPYIMGGTCVCRPSERVMERYRRGGNLTDLTASELENLYREEGISLSAEDQKGEARKHILEEGDSLVCPLPGTTGYQRLFGQLHRPYKPRSAALRDYIDKHPQLRRPDE
jgi:hypothetical protein